MDRFLKDSGSTRESVGGEDRTPYAARGSDRMIGVLWVRRTGPSGPALRSRSPSKQEAGGNAQQGERLFAGGCRGREASKRGRASMSSQGSYRPKIGRVLEGPAGRGYVGGRRRRTRIGSRRGPGMAPRRGGFSAQVDASASPINVGNWSPSSIGDHRRHAPSVGGRMRRKGEKTSAVAAGGHRKTSFPKRARGTTPRP